MVREGWFQSEEEAVRAALFEFLRRHTAPAWLSDSGWRIFNGHSNWVKITTHSLQHGSLLHLSQIGQIQLLEHLGRIALTPK